MQDGENTLLVVNKGIKFNTALNMSSASINSDDENGGESPNRLIEQPENKNTTYTSEASEENGVNLTGTRTASSLLQKKKELGAQIDS